jgi:hypothetical protein
MGEDDDTKVQTDWRWEMLRVTRRLKKLAEEPDTFDAAAKAELLAQSTDLIEHAEGEKARESASWY